MTELNYIQKIHSKLYPTSSSNTHHDGTTFKVDVMVENTKS